MTGKPITQAGMEQALLPDRIEQLGGGLFSCCCLSNDCGLDIFSCICPQWSWASAVSEAGEGSCCVVCILLHCPCYWPLCTCRQAEEINKKLGGKEMECKRCICQCLCSPCAVCQMARAVKNARSKGLLQHQGAPQDDDMVR